MYLENILILAVVLCLLYFVFQFIDKIKLRKLKKNYDEEKDLSRKGEEFRRGIRRISRAGESEERFGRDEENKYSSSGQNKFEGRELLSSADTVPDGKDSRSKRKSGKSSRGIFRKLRRR